MHLWRRNPRFLKVEAYAHITRQVYRHEFK